MNPHRYYQFTAEMQALAAQKARLSALHKVPGRLQALVAEKVARKEMKTK
jgi:hypothetical protein